MKIFNIRHLAALTAVLLAWPALSYATQYPAFSDPGSRAAGGGKAGGGLVPVAETVDGGKLPIGATAQVVVRFRNDGSQPVQTGLIRLYPSSTVSATIAMNQCEEAALPSGAECAIALSVKGLQSGPWRVEMLMSHSGPTRLVTTTVSGAVETSDDKSERTTSDVQTIPDEVDFSTMETSQTLTRPVVLRNITSNAIDISKIYIDASDSSGFTLKADCKKLEAGQSCIAVVAWAPKLPGKVSGVLVVKHNGPAALSSVSLKGEFKPGDVKEAQVFPQAVPGKGLMVASQTELDFGADVQTASTITVSLVNAGDAEMKIEDIKISGSDNGLNYREDGCKKGTILKPIQACPLTITWSPTRVGGLFDDVQVTHDGVRGVLILPVRGMATAAVSQDQKSIVLSETILAPTNPQNLGDEDLPPSPSEPVSSQGGASSVNVASVLDGYRITSFSPDRAIINGPGGSRIVFDNEETVLGGIPWFVVIQKNGIEFLHQGQRILLLFDRSLSPVNRNSSSSGLGGGSGSGSAAPASSDAAASDSAAPDG